jgi:hypothetical protein
MAFTRFHDDPCRIAKQNQEQTGLGRYMLNVPGNGERPLYIEDPYVRMQKWGGNLHTNVVNVESDLLGLTRSLGRDYMNQNNYQKKAVRSERVSCPTMEMVTDQSRATHPAWMVRDLEQVDWYYLPLDPQENTCMPFQANTSSRIVCRDQYVPCVPTPLADDFAGAEAQPGRLCTAYDACGSAM